MQKRDEMRAGEMGSLIVSTLVLPRYKIGDLILAFRPPYFRCIGRGRWWAPLRYGWDELTTLNLGQKVQRTCLLPFQRFCPAACHEYSQWIAP